MAGKFGEPGCEPKPTTNLPFFCAGFNLTYIKI